MRQSSIDSVFAFIDLIDSTRNATYLSQGEYVNSLLMPFQELAESLCNKILPSKVFHSIRGDEVFIRSKEHETNPSPVIQSILEYIFSLKAAIHCHEFNLERIRTQRPPFDIGAGLHFGPAVKIEGRSSYPDAAVEGYSINQTKRIEAASRAGVDTRVVISNSARMGLIKNLPSNVVIIMGEPFGYEAKGIAHSLTLFEIAEFYSDSLYEKIETNIPEFRNWREIADGLNRMSPMTTWPCMLWIGYRFFRALKVEDDGLLGTIPEFVKTHDSIAKKFLPIWIKATLEYAKNDFINAFFDFEKAQEISSERRVILPKLLSALHLIKDDFFKGGERIDNLKLEVHREIVSQDIPESFREAIAELSQLLEV
jgi:hypothetical protein